MTTAHTHDVGAQTGEDHEELVPWWRDRALALPVASGALWVAGLVLEWTGSATPALVVHVLGLAAGGWTFAPGALRRLFIGRGRARLGVGLLMTIAAIGAVLLGHVGEAAALAFLYSIAESLEDRAMDRARRGLRALLSLIPETARVSCLSGERVIPAAEVRELDLLVAGAGERIATDGVVVTGRSWMDTSAITGESIPVEVGPGDAVLAGSVNGSGTLMFEATADGRDNSLTRIVHLVEQAHAAKGERARLADRIARPVVPLVLVAAALIAVAGFIVGDPGTWVERALVVLVAASPCALAIAVPVTVISAIGSASRFGVVIKSGAAFEQLGTIRTVALDKTGTLTRNRPQVVAVRTTPERTEGEVLRLAAALEATSRHPLAEAITAAAPERAAATDVREHAGHGLTGTVHGHRVRVGSPRWIDPQALSEHADAMAGGGMSITVVEIDGQAAGVVGIRDELRPEAAGAIATLHEQGIATVMLTGDNSRTAEAIAAQAGIREVQAEQLPEDKADHVRRSAAQTPTAMIGDGINDAPALASATVGIAMGAAGAAAAVESADVAFTGNDLRLIPDALAHARRGRAIMTGNIALALAIIVVLFPLALFGVLGLAAVVLVHEITEIIVIVNGLRAARVTRRTSGRAHAEPRPAHPASSTRRRPMTGTAPLRWLRMTGLAGVIGAVLWTLGDILIIGAHAPAADYPLIFETYADRVATDKAAMMLPSSESRLAAGALIANVGIVFYLAGSWHLFRGMLPAGRRWAWPVFLLLICGNAWAPLGHAGYYYLGMVYKTLLDTPPDAHRALLDLGAQFHRVLQIAWLLPIVTLGLALLGLGVGIALGRTAWPRWFALVANPLSLVAIGTTIATIAPQPVETWLGGAAFNLGLLVVYLASTILLWRKAASLPPHHRAGLASGCQ